MDFLIILALAGLVTFLVWVLSHIERRLNIKEGRLMITFGIGMIIGSLILFSVKH